MQQQLRVWTAASDAVEGEDGDNNDENKQYCAAVCETASGDLAGAGLIPQWIHWSTVAQMVHWISLTVRYFGTVTLPADCFDEC